MSIKGKSSQEIVSARMRHDSRTTEEEEEAASRRCEASTRTGRMYSSEVIVRRKMQPKVAMILEMSEVQLMVALRGYSSS